MKKGLKMLLSVLLVFSFIVPINADQSRSLFAYTSSTEEFDEYTSDNVGSHMYTYYGYVKESLEVGKGITIYGDVAYPMVLYPVWEGNNIVGAFKVIDMDGVFTGSYSEGNATQLNYLKNVATIDYPVRLYSINGTFVGEVNGITYDVDSSAGSLAYNVDCSQVFFLDSTITNAGLFVEYQDPIIPRVPSTYYLNWTVYHHDHTDQLNCHAYSLYNILRNYGITDYSFNDIQLEFPIQLNPSIPSGSADISEVADFLSRAGIGYRPSTVPNTGNLSYSMVMSSIYTSLSFILAGLTFEGGNTSHHFGVITGYNYRTDGYYYEYRIYDPRNSDSRGLATMSSLTHTFINSKNEVFTWDAGYIIIERP